MNAGHPRLFYGWWIVVGSAVGLFCGIPSTVYTFGIFVKPLTQEFHVSRAAISFGFTLWSITHALGAPFIGRLIGRLGTRCVTVAALAVLGIILISMTVIATDLRELYLAYGCIGLVSGALGPISYGNVISSWFDRRRGLALGVAMLGSGLGAAFMPIIAQHLIADFGWRMAYGVLGCSVLLFAVPVTFILRDNPRARGDGIDGDVERADEWTSFPEIGASVGEAVRSRSFWLMVCGFFLTGVAVQGCVVHLTPMLSDRGLSGSTAALGSAVLGTAVMLSRLGSGYLLDRVFAPRVAILTFSCAALGIILFLFGTTMHLLLAGAFLVGLALGAEIDLIPFLISRYFGLRALPQILGMAIAVFVLSGAAGPLIMGLGFDRSGSYRGVLSIFLVATLLSARLVGLLGPYRYAQRPLRAQMAPEAVRPGLTEDSIA